MNPLDVDIRTMHPRELVRGLMRGDRATLRAGYSADNAVIAADNVHGMTPEARDRLQSYAEGFAAGMKEDPARTLPTDD